MREKVLQELGFERQVRSKELEKGRKSIVCWGVRNTDADTLELDSSMAHVWDEEEFSGQQR